MDPIAWYDVNSEVVLGQYESVRPEAVHSWLQDLVPRMRRL